MIAEAVDVLEPDPLPDRVIERGPHDRGVGEWVPAEKHRYLCRYLNATREAQKRFKQRVLIDPFCGPGRIQVEGESITRDGGSVIAFRQSVLSGAPFTKVLVGDIDSERAHANELRLKARGAPVLPVRWQLTCEPRKSSGCTTLREQWMPLAAGSSSEIDIMFHEPGVKSPENPSDYAERLSKELDRLGRRPTRYSIDSWSGLPTIDGTSPRGRFSGETSVIRDALEYFEKDIQHLFGELRA